MATATETTVVETPPAPAGLFERLYRLSVDQYEVMTRAGILTEDDKVELLEGLIVAKMTKYPPHTRATLALNRFLGRVLPDGWCFGTETPVAIPAGWLGRGSEPEPDFSVLRGESDDYGARTPTVADTALVIEIADTSLPMDSTTKYAIYAFAGIPTYWLVNIPERRVEVHADPSGPSEAPSYRQRSDYGSGEEVPLVLEGREVGRIAVRVLVPTGPEGGA